MSEFLHGNSYYERQGFDIVGDFSMKRRNGSTWLGTLLRIDLQPRNDSKPNHDTRTSDPRT